MPAPHISLRQARAAGVSAPFLEPAQESDLHKQRETCRKKCEIALFAILNQDRAKQKRKSEPEGTQENNDGEHGKPQMFHPNRSHTNKEGPASKNRRA